MSNNKTQTKADAIVVLGAAVWKGGKASPTLRRRAVHGAFLLRRNEARFLVGSGGVGRAINCSELFRKEGWSSAIIVTDHYHLLRAKFLFRRFGIQVSSSPPDKQGSKTSRLHWYYLHIREVLAIPWSLGRIIAYQWKSGDVRGTG